MKHFLYLFVFVLFYAHALGQENSIVGVWHTPPNFSVLTYTFDSSGHVYFKQRGCMSRIAFSGNYTIHNDSIFIQYDTLTSDLPRLYKIKDRIIPYVDTLLLINPHKIQIAHNFFMYNQERDEQACRISSDGLFSFKIRHFGDTFTIKQFTYNEWKTIDTLMNPSSEYIDLVNYPFFLHSGINKFQICINNRVYFNNNFDNELTVEAKKAEVKTENKKVIKTALTFSDTTIYEVQDQYGLKLLSGKGKTIDCRNLHKGKYILNFDNRTVEFIKK
jgi:hypothetical protein